MPSKFDPVRDAVLNSPVTRSTPLPHVLTSGIFAASSTGENSSPVSEVRTISPVGRRALSLSLLLNDDNDTSLFTPASARAPPTSFIANAEESEDRLSHLPPLGRKSSIHIHTSDEPHSPQAMKPLSFHSSHYRSPEGNFVSEPSDLPRPPLTFPVAPLSRSDQHLYYAPLTKSSTIPKSPSPVVAALPYQPSRRITPAASVLKPLTPQEAAIYQRQQGRRLLGKRKRSQSPQEISAAKRSRDVAHVVDHYNARPDVGRDARQESPIIGLKNFNNWIKTVIITRFAHPILLASPLKGPRGTRGKVLDMGCGKGGDLNKWSKAKAKEYVGVDIAAISIEQARGRWESLRGSRVDATFAALDCYTERLTSALSPDQLAEPFDVVSMQFCMHYAFENADKARIMLENVSRWLRPGGIFIGTIPNADQLMERLDSFRPDAQELAFGNSVYQIRFESVVKRPIFGHRYWFYLKDAVEDVPEYVVQWGNFEKMCVECGLQLVYKREFHEIFEEHQEHQEFGPLLQRMKVVTAEGESQMDEDQWEAANVYIGFAFEKRQ